MSPKRAHNESMRLRFLRPRPRPYPPGAIPLSGELGNQCVHRRRRLQSVSAAVAPAATAAPCNSFLSLSLSPLLRASFVGHSKNVRDTLPARRNKRRERKNDGTKAATAALGKTADLPPSLPLCFSCSLEHAWLRRGISRGDQGIWKRNAYQEVGLLLEILNYQWARMMSV